METSHNKLATRSSDVWGRILKSPLFAALVTAAITLAVFIHVLSADFVMWDDNIIIYNNPIIRDLSVDNIGKIFTDIDSMMRYNPLTLLSWSITYHFFKLNPFWYHFGNWLIHGLNTALVFLVLRKLLVLGFCKEPDSNSVRLTISAGLATLLWSIHPLRVEPVAWCTDRTYCQSLLFLLLSLLFYLRASEPSQNVRRHYMLLAFSFVLYVLSLLSYAIVMTFFLVLFILDIYPLRNFNACKEWWKSPANRRTLLEKVPFAATALAIALATVGIRMASAGVWEKPVSLAQFGVTSRVWQAIYIWAYYIWRPWYPVNLSPVYTTLVSFNPLSPIFINSAILVIGIVTLMILLRRRWPLGLALVICYLLLLVPVLGVLEHPHYPCDRYSIIVSILWSILMAAWLAHPKTKTLTYSISIVLTSIVIAILGFMTIQQTRIWTNSKTLFTHTIKMLGNDPYRSDIYWRLGTVYVLEGNTDESIKNYAKAVEIDPNNSGIQSVLGAVLMQKNNAEEAIRHFDAALRINPYDALTYLNRVKALLMLGRFDEAIERLDKFLQQKPDYAEGNYLLYIALANAGKTSQAFIQLKKTVMLAPDWVEPIDDLARILAVSQNPSLRDPNEAIRLAKRGCELTKYQNADLLDTLAVSYASAGKFSEAVHYAEQALSLAKLSSETLLSEKIRGHLYLFQQGQACNE